MEDKENIKDEIRDLANATENYIKIQLELIKLKIIEKTADVISAAFSRIAILIFLVFTLIILNIGLSFYFGELLHKTYYGFFVVSGFYAIITIILYLLRNRFLKTKVSNTIIDILLKED
ncbi:MAG: phage holin family protein [Bacteroidetes bacterium]|nr:phage holin family protein [Bacteroidota bacterium]